MRGGIPAAAALAVAAALAPGVPGAPAGEDPAPPAPAPAPGPAPAPAPAPVRGTLPGATTWSGTVLVDGDVEVPEGAVLRIEAGTRVRIAAADAARSGWNPSLVEIRIAGGIVVAGTEDRPVVFECGGPAAPAGPAPADDAGPAPVFPWHGIVLLPPPSPAPPREIRGALVDSAFAGIQVPRGRATVEGCVFLRCGVGVEVGSAYADAHRKGVQGGVARPVISGCRFAGCITGVHAELGGAPSILRSVFASCRVGAGNSRGRIGRTYHLNAPGVSAERCEFHACRIGVHGPSLVTSGIFAGNTVAVSLSDFHATHATSTDPCTLSGNVFCGNGSILSGEAVAGEFTALESAGTVDDPAALAAALRAPWPPLPAGLALRTGSPARGTAADGGDPGCLGSGAAAGDGPSWTTARARLRRPLVAEAFPPERGRESDPPGRSQPQPGAAAGRSWWCRVEAPGNGVLRTRTLLGRGEGEALFAWRFDAPGGGPAEVEINADLLEATAWWNGEPLAVPLAPRRFDAVGAVAEVRARAGANLLLLRAKGRGVDPRLGVAVSLPAGGAPAEAPLPEPRPGRVTAAAVVRDRARGGAPWLRVTLPAPVAWAPAGTLRLVFPDGSPVDARDARLRAEGKLVLLFGPLPDAALGGCGVLLEGFRGPDGAPLDFGPVPVPVAPAPPR